MVFASSVVLFDASRGSEVLDIISTLKNVEIYNRDMDGGKLVIVTEADDKSGVEDVEKTLLSCTAVIDVAHAAFYFGEEVDKILNGTAKLDPDFEKIFKE